MYALHLKLVSWKNQYNNLELMYTLKHGSQDELNWPMTIANKNITLRQTLLITGAMLLLLYGAILFIYQHLSFNQIKTEFQQRISSEIDARQHTIQKNINKQHQRIQFLYTIPPIQGIARATANNGIDPVDQTKLKGWKTRLSTIFEGYLQNYPDINQIRYIGVANNGKEIVRVDRRGSHIKTITPTRLQSKGDTDYFKEISKYHPRKVYISNINLNREYGEIQLPYSPTQRIAMPVFGLDNKIFGIVIINIDAPYQIDEFTNSLNEDLSIYILNSSGGYVYNPANEMSFLFEFNKDSNWRNDFQEMSEKVNGSDLMEAVNLESNKKIYYLSNKILLSGIEEGRFLTLVIGVDESILNAFIYDRTRTLAEILGVLLVIVFVLFSVYQVNIHKRISMIYDQAEFKAIVSGSHEGIVAMDKLGIINSWNNAANNITGYTEQMAKGQSVFDLFLTDAQKKVIEPTIKSVYENGDSITFECHAKTRKGSHIILVINLSPITLDSGNTIGVAALFSDVTGKKQIEKDILELNSSLEEKVKNRTKELEDARNNAIDANMIKSDFIANVSHEIRTPMNGVLGMLDLLAKDTLTKRQRHQLEMAKYSAQNLTHLVNDILDMSKIESGKLEVDESEFNLVKLLSDISSSLSIRIQAKDIDLILDATKIQHENVIGDSMRINQIITNLVGNSLKFTEQGEIIVTAETQEKNNGNIILKCNVMDTGKGIAPDKIDSLFESFTQENSSITKQYGGTGLGLTISRQLCTLMNGSITANSIEGEGSTFSFDVELQTSPAKENEILDRRYPKSTILIASANVRLLESLDIQLQNFGCETHIADSHYTLHNALEGDQTFDLALVDDQLSNTIISELEEFNMKGVIDKSTIYILESSKDSLIDRHHFKNIMKPVTPVSLVYCLNNVFNCNDPSKSLKNTNKNDANNPLKGCSILIVDDNLINLEVAQGVIEEFEADIILANSAQACFEEISKQHFDFVLMDCQMPKMDGYTATRKIRNGEFGDANKDLVIIAMTAHAMTGARDTCITAGMNDYIPKPINPAFIKATLLKWVDPK